MPRRAGEAAVNQTQPQAHVDEGSAPRAHHAKPEDVYGKQAEDRADNRDTYDEYDGDIQIITRAAQAPRHNHRRSLGRLENRDHQHQVNGYANWDKVLRIASAEEDADKGGSENNYGHGENNADKQGQPLRTLPVYDGKVRAFLPKHLANQGGTGDRKPAAEVERKTQELHRNLMSGKYSCA